MRGMMNGSRPQNVGPMGGRGRAPPGRVDQGKKAVFRNREQDLQDPDYNRRSIYRCCVLAFPHQALFAFVAWCCHATATYAGRLHVLVPPDPGQ